MLVLEKLSYWERKTYFTDIDFAIIGAGITGYSTSLHLRKLFPDAKIVIFEQGYLPSGASSKNAGFACFGSATELFDDISSFGETIVWDTVKMRWEGLKYLRTLIGDEHLKLEINGSWDLITEKECELFDAVVPQIPYYNQKLEEITGERDVYSIDDSVCDTFGFRSIQTSIYNRLE